MNVLSLFSGAGGLDLGLESAGHTIVAQCEIDPTARKVLRRHWPFSPLHDDVTVLDPEEFRGRIDLVAGGSPCQDLSVAGRRGGLDGARSGLFWHQCRIADSAAAPWVLWENVAGAFSSNDGADFAAVLWGLTGTLPRVPDGGWRTAGVVVGPKRTAVWRLLDAQWYGVAQRRRRVFVVAGPRGLCGPQVLLKPEGVRGDPAPSREAREAVAGSLGTSPLKHPDDLDGHGTHILVTPSDGHVPAPLGFPLTLPDVVGTLSPGVLMPDLAVRRLTPRECERLMGWPDDHTRWAFDGSEIADSQRYRMCGNGVVAPVAEWIGRRILGSVA